MNIARIYDNLESILEPNKVVILYGPRRVGKTTLLKNFLARTNLRYNFNTGEDIRVQTAIASQDLQQIKDFVGDVELVAIDEAQMIPNIGIGLKLIVDQIPNIKVIVTGSASFELANKVGEPLVGRQWTKMLYPVSILELKQQNSAFELTNSLEDRLIFGSYPEAITLETSQKKRAFLDELTSSYLLKDILAIEQVKSPKLLHDLLKLLAFQVGSEVSLTELGSQLGIDKNTVARYLDLLEKSFILYNLRGFNRNMRKAISKKSKYYFWDNGIRNAIINNYNPLDTRDDIGQLWENFLAIERVKKQAYTPIYSNNYFWRTWEGKEVDWVEMRDGKLHGFEFKWKKTSSKHEQAWLEAYPGEATFEVVSKNNFLDFVS